MSLSLGVAPRHQAIGLELGLLPTRIGSEIVLVPQTLVTVTYTQHPRWIGSHGVHVSAAVTCTKHHQEISFKMVLVSETLGTVSYMQHHRWIGPSRVLVPQTPVAVTCRWKGFRTAPVPLTLVTVTSTRLRRWMVHIRMTLVTAKEKLLLGAELQMLVPVKGRGFTATKQKLVPVKCKGFDARKTATYDQRQFCGFKELLSASWRGFVQRHRISSSLAKSAFDKRRLAASPLRERRSKSWSS